MVRRSKGFSLIELLVAMAIMSMTLLISSMGYSFFMDRWQKNLGVFDLSAGTAKKLLLTKYTILGISPYILRDSNNNAVIYFEGNEDGLVGVTTRSFFNSDIPSVIRFSLKQQDDFTFHLLYEESPMLGPPLTTIKQTIEYKRKVILLENLTDIKFSYYGNKDLGHYINGGEKIWWQSFNSLNRKLLPQSIRISFVIKGQEERLEFPMSQVDTRMLALFDDKS